MQRGAANGSFYRPGTGSGPSASTQASAVPGEPQYWGTERIGVASAGDDVEGAARATLGALNRYLASRQSEARAG